MSDETIDELKAQSLLSSERFLDLLIDKIGYTNFLKEQIAELPTSGDPMTQMTVLQGAIGNSRPPPHRLHIVPFTRARRIA